MPTCTHMQHPEGCYAWQHQVSTASRTAPAVPCCPGCKACNVTRSLLHSQQPPAQSRAADSMTLTSACRLPVVSTSAGWHAFTYVSCGSPALLVHVGNPINSRSKIHVHGYNSTEHAAVKPSCPDHIYAAGVGPNAMHGHGQGGRSTSRQLRRTQYWHCQAPATQTCL